MYGWGSFISHAAVRKIVYVLVGLALAFVLHAGGVRADASVSLGAPVACTGGGCEGWWLYSSEFFIDAGDAVTLTLTDVGGFAGGGFVDVECSSASVSPAWSGSADFGEDWTYDAGSAAVGTYGLNPGDGLSGRLRCRVDAEIRYSPPALAGSVTAASLGLTASGGPSATPDPAYGDAATTALGTVGGMLGTAVPVAGVASVAWLAVTMLVRVLRGL